MSPPNEDRPRVLVTEEIAEAGIALLRDAGVEVDVRYDLDQPKLVEVIPAYDGLIVRSATKVTRDVIEAGERLRVIGRAGIGVDNVEVDAATRRGIVVVNAPQGNIISNAEHTIGLLLALARKIPQAHASLVEGRWERSRFMGAELHDKTVGIVGLGRVGTLVAQRCLSFGMRPLGRDPYVTAQRAARLGVELVEMDELLARSDVIVLCVTKTAETHHLVSASELERCKPGVLIVNSSRGGVLDEEALAKALASGKVGGAALDVFEAEPMTESPLFGLDNVVVTPHIGASTAEAQDKAGIIAAEQVLLALRGEFVPNAVNLEAGGELPDFVRPFLELSTKLGRLAAALAGEAVTQLEVAYLGPIAEEDTRVLTLSALRGFLQSAVHEPVTFVNAPLLAADRGLSYSEKRSATSGDYTNLVRVTAHRDDRVVTVAGTLAGRKNEPRLVEIDDLPIEVGLSPHMAFFRYEDRPGVVHALSGVLMSNGINIASMEVGRRGKGEEAIMALGLDSPVPDEALQEMIEAAQATSGRAVSLDSA